MATYGIKPVPGQVAWTGYSNTLGSGQANQDATAGYVMFNGVQQGDDRLAKMFRNGGMTIALTQVLAALLGVAPGALASRSKKQVQGLTQGSQSGLGAPNGLVTIETITQVNRNTTAADVTAFQALLSRFPFPTTYPPDLSGNGGGGKQASAGGGAY